MRFISRLFLNGILVLIPIVLTFYVVYWLITGFESIFRNVITFFFSSELYFPGLGTLLGLAIIFVVGLLMQNWGMIRLYKYGEKLIEKFPLMGDIYSSLNSLLQYFMSSSKESPEQVVIVEYQGVKVLGIVTRENFTDCPAGIGGEDIIAVFLPMSYQIGGYTIYLNRKHVTPVEMTKKAALQWILTAGLFSKKTTEIKPAVIKDKP